MAIKIIRSLIFAALFLTVAGCASLDDFAGSAPSPSYVPSTPQSRAHERVEDLQAEIDKTNAELDDAYSNLRQQENAPPNVTYIHDYHNDVRRLKSHLRDLRDQLIIASTVDDIDNTR